MNGTWETNAVYWVSQYQSEIITFIALTLLLCGMAMGIRYLWLRYFRDAGYWLYKKLFRNPWQMLIRPIRRFHSRWSERNKRATMAKWKKEIVAEIFYDSLSKACEEQLISKKHKRKLMTELADFFGISDLKRPNNHPEAIKLRNEAVKARIRRESEIGPKGKIPGGKPGENVVPLYEGLGHRYLQKKKGAA